MKSSGMKTATSDIVSEMTVNPISFAPRRAACSGSFAIFHVTHDVLDHDDGVVDHKARAYREGHERQVVEGKSAEPHHAESCDQ